MKTKTKKIIIGALLVLIGFPVVFLAVVLAWGYISDRTNGSIVSSGIACRYLLYAPNSYGRSKPTPLIISIHPAATWRALEMNITRWNDLAEQYGFLVVHPNGSGAFFGGFSPGVHVWPMGHAVCRATSCSFPL